MNVRLPGDQAGEPVTLHAAAVQLEGVPGDVAENLRRLERLITEAAATGAELIGVPEFATSPLPFLPDMHDCVLPPDNAALTMLREAARRHHCRIGGSMLIADAGEIYNRYHLVEPDGTVHLHDKDLPTMWEGAFYGPGNDDGVFQTGIGPVGAAVCWELIRTQTARRLKKGRVGIVMSGTHWWTLPTNWGTAVTRALGPLGQYNRYLSENAPSELARRVGAPVLQASHCGEFRTDFMVAPRFGASLPYETRFVGATQIVDADGRVLTSRNTSEGAGIVHADVNVGAVDPVEHLENTYWLPRLPLALKAYWHQQNVCARSYYRRTGREAGLEAVHATAARR